MKIRTGHVSNSSSSSFIVKETKLEEIISRSKPSEEEMREQVVCEYSWELSDIQDDDKRETRLSELLEEREEAYKEFMREMVSAKGTGKHISELSRVVHGYEQELLCSGKPVKIYTTYGWDEVKPFYTDDDKQGLYDQLKHSFESLKVPDRIGCFGYQSYDLAFNEISDDLFHMSWSNKVDRRKLQESPDEVKCFYDKACVLFSDILLELDKRRLKSYGDDNYVDFVFSDDEGPIGAILEHHGFFEDGDVSIFTSMH